MPIYMKCEEVKGEVTAEGYKDTVEVLSFQYGAGMPVTAPSTSNTGKRTEGHVSLSEITISKMVDNASGVIFDKLAAGTSVPKIEFFFSKATGSDASGNDNYLVVTIEDVFFSGQSFSSGGGLPSESVSLNYAKIKTNYMKDSVKGDLTQGSLSGWDLTTNKHYA